MPKNPHAYSMKWEWKDKKLFEAIVLFIRENGKKEYFYKTPYFYFYANGYKYWTMGAPLNKTILINRAKI